MKRVLFEPERGQRVPVWIWARDPSPEATRQLQEIASRPYVVSHVAAMPDAHMADGVAVGTVFATERTVVPAALGGDLGCGVAAMRFDVSSDVFDRRRLERVLEGMARAVPVGDKVHRGRGVVVPDELMALPLSTHALEKDRDRLARAHLGTLGGGNHFLELDRDAEGCLWLLVHSGSRGLGAAIAAHHRQAAQAHGSDKLAALDVESDAGAGYVADSRWAIDFARTNRECILARATETLVEEFGAAVSGREQVVDVHHNFVAREEHGGRSFWVHRKGAIGLLCDELGIVPGSMGTATYLVRGLGGAEAWRSCSHGAGRRMTRSQARRTVRPQAFAASMRRIVYRAPDTAALVEEAPEGYRDIREVLEDEEDLVTPVRRLEPVAVLKG
jgi:tRNA-splicing ligase RtcB (3'-phosphate/5'-hydroxy nucleic acid ligase)